MTVRNKYVPRHNKALQSSTSLPFVVLVCLLVLGARADLPIHCIKAQVEGTWEFSLGALKETLKPEDATCGFLRPSGPMDALLNTPGAETETKEKLTVKLDKYNQVYFGDKIVGKWGMLYDEGILMELKQPQKLSLMVFFHYFMNDGKSTTDCSKTLVGWMHVPNTKMMGCFFGVQTERANPIESLSQGEAIVGIETIPLQSTSIVRELAGHATGHVGSLARVWAAKLQTNLQEGAIKQFAQFSRPVSLAQVDSDSLSMTDEDIKPVSKPDKKKVVHVNSKPKGKPKTQSAKRTPKLAKNKQKQSKHKMASKSKPLPTKRAQKDSKAKKPIKTASSHSKQLKKGRVASKITKKKGFRHNNTKVVRKGKKTGGRKFVNRKLVPWYFNKGQKGYHLIKQGLLPADAAKRGVYSPHDPRKSNKNEKPGRKKKTRKSQHSKNGQKKSKGVDGKSVSTESDAFSGDDADSPRVPKIKPFRHRIAAPRPKVPLILQRKMTESADAGLNKKVKTHSKMQKMEQELTRRKRAVKVTEIKPVKINRDEIKVSKKPKSLTVDKDYNVHDYNVRVFVHWMRKPKTDAQLANELTSLAQTGVAQTVFESKTDPDAPFDAKPLVDRINDSNLGWKASEYSFLAGKSITEINQLSGRVNLFPEVRNRGLDSDVSSRQSFARTFSELPTEFSWDSKMTAPRQQEHCGNCYLVASIGMLESRLRIKHNRDMRLSIQYLNDCNFYAQGCQGGFALEALRYVNQFWAVPESCKEFTATQGICSGHCKISSLSELVTVDPPYYVGEFYGKTNEQLLMEELYKNGPIVVSFEPTMEFSFYKSGIFRPSRDTVAQEFAKETQWMKVDHSVLLYGWGEENGTKYWKIQNSWGDKWGEAGSFRILRGQNTLGIETMGEAAIPKVISVSETTK